MRKIILLISFAVYYLLLVTCFAPSAQAQSATLSLSPATKTVTNGSTFSAEVRVNTGGEAINTVTANLSYPSTNLKVQSIDTSGSFATIWFELDFSTSGSIKLTGSLPTPGTTGSNLLFATINFLAQNEGTAQVSFDASSATYRNSDSSNILGTKTGAIYTISSTTPPTPTSTPTPTPTPTSTLPDVGIEEPTIMLVVFATFLLLISSLILRIV